MVLNQESNHHWERWRDTNRKGSIGGFFSAGNLTYFDMNSGLVVICWKSLAPYSCDLGICMWQINSFVRVNRLWELFHLKWIFYMWDL